MEITLSQENFDQEVIKSEVPVLVDFWAEWCGPCHVIAPIVSQIAEKYQDKIRVGKLNVDENPDIANRYRVFSIPTLKLFKNGKIVDEAVGVTPMNVLNKKVEAQIA